jgi:hypothetical protein
MSVILKGFMTRIANYRSCDRAETLGVTLLQMVCAVAQVPRSEDLGIFDAIATLLRREGALLYPEDSLLVQFKSRTEKTVEYLDLRFESLLRQELALFIGHVDLSQAPVKLYSVGAALAHPNINDLKGLVVYLDPIDQRFEDGVLHTSLGEPVLAWSTAQLVDTRFEEEACAVLRRWLVLDRWNRRHRKMGIRTQIRWKTNEVPTEIGTAFVWNPQRAAEALDDVVPAIQMIAGLAASDSTLAAPVLRLISWMRSKGVDPDPSDVLWLSAVLEASREKLSQVLEKHPDADVAVQLIVTKNTVDECVFWVHAAGRHGGADAQKHSGTAAELEAQGFSVQVDATSTTMSEISLGEKWLKDKGCQVLGAENGVQLLKCPKAHKAVDSPRTAGSSGNQPA